MKPFEIELVVPNKRDYDVHDLLNISEPRFKELIVIAAVESANIVLNGKSTLHALRDASEHAVNANELALLMSSVAMIDVLVSDDTNNTLVQNMKRVSETIKTLKKS